MLKTILSPQILSYALIIYFFVTVIRYAINLWNCRTSIILNQLDISTGIFGTMGSGKDLLMCHIVRIYDKLKKSKLKNDVRDYQLLSKYNPSLKEQYNYFLDLYKNKRSFIYSNIPYRLCDNNYSYINNLNGLAIHTHDSFPYVDGDLIAISEAGLIFPSTDYKNLDKKFYSMEYLVKLIRHMFDGTFIYNDQHPNRVWVSIREKTARFIQIKERREILSFTLTRKIVSLVCLLPLPGKISYKLHKLSTFLRSLSFQRYVLDCYENSEDYNTDLSNKMANTRGRAWHIKYCFPSCSSYGKYDTRAFQFVGTILKNQAKINSFKDCKQFDNIFLTEDNLFNLGYQRLTDILSNNYKSG